jgi:hypothetical protein
MATPQPIDRSDESFPQAAAAVMTELTTALTAVLEGCDGVPGSRPIDISRGLGIDMKLAWKASHLANAASPFDAVRHIPGAAGVRILLDAAAARGCDGAVIERAGQAFESVRTFISRRAGSRRAFESMVAGIEGARDRRLEQEHRRLLFDGASSVWGMRADLLYRFDVLFPSSISGLLDCVTVRSMVGARRLRGGVILPFPRPRIIDDRGQETRIVLDEPLDPAVKAGELPLMDDFCAGPVPVFKLRRIGDAAIHEAAAAESADPAPFTVTTGEVLRAVQPTRVTEDTHGIFQLMRLRMPAERAVFDVLVHDDLLDSGVEPDVYLSSDLHGTAQGVGDVRRVRMPVSIRCESLPTDAATEVEHFGRLDGIVDRAMVVAGTRLEHFRWFRIELAYPPITSTIAFECEQPSG